MAVVKLRAVIMTVLVFLGLVLGADLVAGRVFGLSGAAYAAYGVGGILLAGAAALWIGRRVGRP